MRKISGLILAIAHLFWLIFLCCIIAYNYKVFKGRGDLNPVQSAWGYFFGFANLATALYTANFITIFWNLDKSRSAMLYGAVVVVQFAFMGAYYLYPSFELNPGVFSEYDKALITWGNQVYNAWTVILFAWDIIPVSVIMSRATYGIEGDWLAKSIGALKLDFPSSIMLLSQFPIAAAYLINEIVRTSSSAMGNDRNYQSSRAFSIMFVVMHCLLNTVIIYRVAQTVQTSQISSNNKLGATGGKNITNTKQTTSGIITKQATGMSYKHTETEN